uniref:Letm1 RBD domain-containing protein n=1 Tax=Pseudictyota dubia TaxID=2749911 RepID=A0A7R9W8U5_9STRA|mmetsp:Transcript_37175/g.68845  ORF Transcript_37175/g.68845 Transcript_37175/m.68845 type:complete len:423 (+) Transcript_37175:28-1296(+)
MMAVAAASVMATRLYLSVAPSMRGPGMAAQRFSNQQAWRRELSLVADTLKPRRSVGGMPIFPLKVVSSVRTIAFKSSISRKESPKVPPEFKTLTLWEQILSFPTNVKELYADALTYLNIEAASKTPRNAWGGRTPRRQRAFQRWMRKEIAKVAIPVVGYVAVPILGNIFILLAVSFPRVMLSQHFLSERQIRTFAADEYAYETKYNRLLGEYLHSTLSAYKMNMADIARKAGVIEVDDPGGPTFADAQSFYLSVFGDSRAAVEYGVHSRKPALSDFALLPRPHLLALAHATGAVPPPHLLTTPLFDILPKAFIARRVNAVAADLVRDDFMLIEEGHHRNGCSNLTDFEVLDACLARCLPTLLTSTKEDMRQSLTGHLEIVAMIEEVAKSERMDHENIEGRHSLKSFIMHLPSIRLWVKENKV